MPGAIEMIWCRIARRTCTTGPGGAAGRDAGYASCWIASVSAFAGAMPAKLALGRAPAALFEPAMLIDGAVTVGATAVALAAATWASCLASCADVASQTPIGIITPT